MQSASRFFALLVLCLVCGCSSGKHPVQGSVLLEDGSPLTKGLVVIERIEGGVPITARGEIQANGHFALSTDQPGDGVPEGRYRVLINSLDLSDVSDEQKNLPFDTKYLKFENSGLELVVNSKITDHIIKLSRPAGGKKPSR